MQFQEVRCDVLRYALNGSRSERAEKKDGTHLHPRPLEAVTKYNLSLPRETLACLCTPHRGL